MEPWIKVHLWSGRSICMVRGLITTWISNTEEIWWRRKAKSARQAASVDHPTVISLLKVTERRKKISHLANISNLKVSWNPKQLTVMKIWLLAAQPPTQKINLSIHYLHLKQPWRMTQVTQWTQWKNHRKPAPCRDGEMSTKTCKTIKLVLENHKNIE